MQISGVMNIQKEAVVEDTTTHDLYHSLVVKLTDIVVTIPKPLFLKDGDKKIGFVMQYTASGTYDLKLIPYTPPSAQSDEELQLAAEAEVRANRTRVAEPVDPNKVDRESDEFKEALKKIKSEAKAGNKGEFPSTIKASIGKDGKLASGKNA